VGVDYVAGVRVLGREMGEGGKNSGTRRAYTGGEKARLALGHLAPYLRTVCGESKEAIVQ